jgi:hypothetical protein
MVHADTAESVDRLLAGRPVGGERRKLIEGRMVSEGGAPRAATPAKAPPPPPRQGPQRIYAHALSKDVLARVLDDMQIPARVVDDPARASVVLALRARAGDRGLREVAARGVEIHEVKKNSSAEMRRVLRNVFAVVPGVEEDLVRDAVTETERAIARVLADQVPVSLSPRPAALRKMQHRLVARHHLEAASAGHEPFRHLVIYPVGGPEP